MYLIPIVTGIGGILILAAEWLDTRKRPSLVPEFAMPWRVRIFGGVVILIAAFYGAINAGIQQGRVEALTIETRDLLTGGNSSVIIDFITTPQNRDKIWHFVAQLGDDVPAFDVQIEYTTTGMCDSFGKWTARDVLNTGTNNPRFHYIPAVAPNTIRPLRGSLEPSCIDSYYQATMNLRNRSLVQQTFIHKDVAREHFRFATRVTDVDTGKIVAERRDPLMPSPLEWPDLSGMQQVRTSTNKLIDDYAVR